MTYVSHHLTSLCVFGNSRNSSDCMCIRNRKGSKLSPCQCARCRAPLRRQPFFTPGGMVAFINSILVGAFVSLLLYALWTLPLLPCVGAGVAAFLVSVGLHLRYQWKHWQWVSKRLTVLFPSDQRLKVRRAFPCALLCSYLLLIPCSNSSQAKGA
jgi:hypothetical protein